MNNIWPPRRETRPADDDTADDREARPLRHRTPWGTVTGRVIAVVSRKGGVGKTTSAVNLSAAFALSGHSVLVVGVDSQCGVCRTLGCAPAELPTALDDLFADDVRLTDLAQPAPLDGLWFVAPRIDRLEDEERFVCNLESRAGLFAHEVDRARNLYDTIIIDCPPGLGAATRAALLSADGYLVPVQAEELCRESVGALVEFVDEFRARHELGPGDTVDGAARAAATPLALEGMFLTMANTRTRVGRHVAERAAEDYGDLLLKTAIPRATRVAEMALHGRPAVIYDRRGAASRAYFDLADELVHRYCLNRRGDGPDREAVDADARHPAGDAVAVAGPSQDLGRFERFLLDLAGPEEAWQDQAGDPSPAPEMVSLEDLLAEEEADHVAGERPWDERYWSFDGEGRDHIN